MHTWVYKKVSSWHFECSRSVFEADYYGLNTPLSRHAAVSSTPNSIQVCATTWDPWRPLLATAGMPRRWSSSYHHRKVSWEAPLAFLTLWWFIEISSWYHPGHIKTFWWSVSHHQKRFDGLWATKETFNDPSVTVRKCFMVHQKPSSKPVGPPNKSDWPSRMYRSGHQEGL